MAYGRRGFYVVFGVSHSFGVFFEPMAAEFHESRAATSALFSITGFISYMLASVTASYAAITCWTLSYAYRPSVPHAS
ncbi:MAG TPA: hypothetical protein VFB33_15355 [Candidatus Binataceae bacterium]|nr:hypothetical protein [Candidatus Binataceae bacterium]